MNTKRSETIATRFLEGTRGRRLTRENSAVFDAEPGVIGALMCPAREYDWIPLWECRLVYTDSGYLEDGCVFTTHGHSHAAATWICSRYEPNEAVEYVKLDEHTVTRLRIHVVGLPDGQTKCTWEHEMTALDGLGDAHIEKIENEQKVLYESFPMLIRHYLETGEMAHKEKAQPV